MSQDDCAKTYEEIAKIIVDMAPLDKFITVSNLLEKNGNTVCYESYLNQLAPEAMLQLYRDESARQHSLEKACTELRNDVQVFSHNGIKTQMLPFLCLPPSNPTQPFIK